MSRAICLLTAALSAAGAAGAERQMEDLGRGVVAVLRGDGSGYVGWRLLGTDPEDIAFNVYRVTDDSAKAGMPAGPPAKLAVKLNDEPITGATNFVDADAGPAGKTAYLVRPVLRGRERGAGALRLAQDAGTEPVEGAGAPCALRATAPGGPYLAIPLGTPPGYTPNDAAVGDLDGDGEYDIVLKQEMKPRDNAHRGVCPGTTKLEGYTLRGSFLWRIDLGRNIREGAHYTPFIVYDLDGDGVSEVAVRTSERTADGTGAVIGDVDGDGRTDYVNPETGYILEGPEFVSIFDGRTGRELARADYIARGRVSDWGDRYGNRVDRFLMGVAYLDGRRPSLVICRGYYALTKLEAWNWRDGRLTKVWSFSSSDPGHAGYAGQGNHSLAVGDVDGDGRDEIVYGACCIDDDGTGLYTTRLSHGDAMHLSDMDPGRPGLEVFAVHERRPCPAGAEFRDAATGELIWGVPSTRDVGRGVAMDIDPGHPGYEMWAAGGIRGLYNCRGERFSEARPRSCNMGVWWDGDPLREILDGTVVDKWDHENGSTTRLLSAHEHGCASNNGSKANPCICADILGDWREEVVWRSEDNRELRIFTTAIPTDRRLHTLMHDPVYRVSAALQNVGYNQPAHPGFFLGHGMEAPPRPPITTRRRTRRGRR